MSRSWQENRASFSTAQPLWQIENYVFDFRAKLKHKKAHQNRRASDPIPGAPRHRGVSWRLHGRWLGRLACRRCSRHQPGSSFSEERETEPRLYPLPEAQPHDRCRGQHPAVPHDSSPPSRPHVAALFWEPLAPPRGGGEGLSQKVQPATREMRLVGR